MTLPDGNGVYIIVNKATGTVVDLGDGQTANGTKVTAWASYRKEIHSFNQMWLIEQVTGQAGETFYTVRNVRSNTYLDLCGGSPVDGTDVQGWQSTGGAAQHWYIQGDNQTGYIFKNRAAGTVLDLLGWSSENGTSIKCYGSHGGANQTWFLRCHSRSSDQLDSLLHYSPLVGMNFNHYVSDDLYITLPPDVIRSIWDKKGLVSRKRRAESYDCDDFTFSMKAAIGDWVYDNIRAPVAIAFGIMYYGGGPNGKCAYNWYPTDDFSSIMIFEPQSGQEKTSSASEAYFGIY